MKIIIFVKEKNLINILININNKVEEIIIINDFNYLMKYIKSQNYNKIIVDNINYYSLLIKRNVNNLMFYENDNNDIDLLNENEIKHRIKEKLSLIYFNYNNIGTKYIIDIIYLIYLNKDYLNNMKNKAFKIIENIYNVSYNSVKSAIFMEIERSFYNCEQYKYDNYFGRSIIEKPKLAEIITKTLEKI